MCKSQTVGSKSLRQLAKYFYFAFLCNAIFTMNDNISLTIPFLNVHDSRNISVFGSSLYSVALASDSWYLSMIWQCSTKLLVMSQGARLSQSSSLPTHVEWGWGQETVEDGPGQSGFLGLPWPSVVVSKLWGVFGLIMLQQYESFSRKMEPEGEACLWMMEWCLSSLRVESVLCRSTKTSSSTVLHCGVETLWYCALLCSSPYITPFCTHTLIYHCDSSVSRPFSSTTVKFWHFWAHLECLSLFPSWEVFWKLLLILWDTIRQPCSRFFFFFYLSEN